jgi:hypothetical protein
VGARESAIGSALSGSGAGTPGGSGLSPGKQTLTAALGVAPVQRRADGDRAGGEPADVHAAAAIGTSGPTTELPHFGTIQRAFGRHDVSGIKAHVGGQAEAGATAMGAEAFATGDRVAFRGAPDLRTAAHEAAHVVQQRGGVHLAGGVGDEGDLYEQHADDVADLVVRGESAEALLDQRAGGGAAGGGKGGSGGAIQRHAFVHGKQIKKSDPLVKSNGAIAAFVADTVVRDYKSRDEMTDHAAGSTDYIGNLADGTWLRFQPKGLNVLGEMHTLVTLSDVMKAVGSTSFISERFTTDDLAAGSQLKTEYDSAANDKYKEMGVDGDPDKKKYGAESLFPKIGFALSGARPFFDGTKPIEDLSTKEGYAGKPVQRYLKLGWAHAKDLRAQVTQQLRAKQTVSAPLITLCKTVAALEPKLDAFITGLPNDGFLGDAVIAAADPDLLAELLQLSDAIIDAMFERALSDPTARLDDKRKQELGSSPSSDDKFKVFADWRNFNFEDSVKKAAADGVRYAGMGAGHLYYLQATKTLPPGSHDYDMSGKDLETFENRTKKLASRATKP